MRKNIFLLMLCCIAQFTVAQQLPKWGDKAKKAVFSVVTYDADNNILNTGNGFFVQENGIALSDYALFKGAQSAIVIDTDGKKMPVDAILGANDMYDVIKFRVKTDKKVPALSIADGDPQEGEEVYLLPYSTQKDRSYTKGKINNFSTIDDNKYYYTLGLKLKDKMVSCPVTNTDGKVLGLVQKSISKDSATVCHAVDARFAVEQSINPLSLTNLSLRNVGIKMGIPEDQDQALVFLYMASSQMPADQYAVLLDDFIAQFPGSPDGYMRRALNYVAMDATDASIAKAQSDMDQALKIASKKDDIHYNLAKLIYSYQLSGEETTYKDWSYDRALSEVRTAISLDPLPVYVQLEGDILFAMKDYEGAYACYEKVNASNLVSPATFFSAAKAKELQEADSEVVLALMDSCIAHCVKPYSYESAPYLLERARVRMDAGKARYALQDYDEYYTAVNGAVNDVFYYIREQAAFQAKQFQRALDDIIKAIEMNPQEMAYRAELGLINLRVGRNDEALRVLGETIGLFPDFAEAYKLQGLTYLQMKKSAEACAAFSKAKELGDSSVDELIEKHCK